MAHFKFEKKISRNTNIFKLYNEKRKVLFKEISPDESIKILYLLPWLLSVNHRNCPGYLPELETCFKVFGIDRSYEIKKREPFFKRLFNIQSDARLYGRDKDPVLIEGLYTIGSIGTIAQTAYSDCDIWVCANFSKIGHKNQQFLVKKINIIKDWFDENCKIPVFFFISDVNNIKKGYFGNLDEQSSGSAQKNLLMEEFYRTTIVIMGKIPFWWVCFDRDKNLDYKFSYKCIKNSIGGGYEYIDFGDIPEIKSDEFLGASLWQLHKALASPLKSVIKMALLKRHIDDSSKRPAAELFREKVFLSKKSDFIDPMSFTIDLLVKSMSETFDEQRLLFLKECFFLRCSMNIIRKKNVIKKRLVKFFIENCELPEETRRHLENFKNWNMTSQILLGKRLVEELFSFYKIISSAERNNIYISNRDLTVLGRRIASIYKKKKDKVNLVPKPIEKFNLIDITYVYDNGLWFLYSGNNRTVPLYKGTDIVSAVSFAVWNDLFMEGRVRMEPNHTSVSLPEIVNLSHKLKAFLGKCDVLDTSPVFYLKDEKIQKIFIVVSFEETYYEKNVNNFALICKTTWGELFVKRAKSPRELEHKLKYIKDINRNFQIDFYLQRNSSYYEKIIRRARDIVETSFLF
ncbi:MAG: hypothetical protein CSA18_02730 [Deltaproteobacteria bacterium]|nr:MAG: hypothetical protein CSA18_02730 [Deltaproteobacteria bacterium]